MSAGFLQTKLQQLRDGTRQAGFVGDVGPSTPELTMDADEAYFGVYMSPEAAPASGHRAPDLRATRTR